MQTPLSLQLIVPFLQFYAFIAIMRALMQYLDADFHHPISRFVHSMTSLPIRLLRVVVPRVHGADLLSPLALALLVCGIEQGMLILASPYGLSIPAVVFLTIAIVLDRAITILLIAVLIRVIMSWVPLGLRNTERLIYSCTEPLMARARRILPQFGGLDFSPIAVLLAFEVFSWIGVGFLEAVGKNLLIP